MDDTELPEWSEAELAALLPRYRDFRLLASTRMSRVYRAVDQHVAGQPVAVKILARHLSSEPSARERFRREVRIATMVRHPNIVPIVNASTHGDPVHLAMPYIERPAGQGVADGSTRSDPARSDLAAVLAHHPRGLGLPRTIRIVRQIARALDHAHARGVLHRDVKPSNIMLAGAEPHEYALLADFSVAAEVSDDGTVQAGARVGTVGSSPPECLHPASPTARYDRRVDVYSLGTVIHHCLTGRPAFAADDHRAVTERQLSEDPPPASSLRWGLPPTVDAVIHRAVDRDIRRRYGTCGDLVDDLERAASGRRTLAPVRPAWAAIRRIMPVPRPAVTAAAVAAVVLIALAAVILPGDHGSGAPTASQLARVPVALRAHCRAAGASAGYRGASAVLSCRANGQSVLFSLYDHSSTVDSVYADAVRRSDVAQGTGDCAVAVGAEHRYPTDGPETGRVVCYRHDYETTFVWTDTDTRTVARADRREIDDLDFGSEWAKWVHLPSFPTSAEQSLIDLVKLQDCRRSSPGSVDAFRDLSAAIDCHGKNSHVTGISYYRFDSRHALTSAEDTQAGAVDAPSGVTCTANVPGFVAEHQLDMRSAIVGDLLCYRDERHAPVLEWTFEPLDVMGRATGTSVSGLLNWWWGYFGFDPPTAALADALNRQATPAFPTADERNLLSHIPDASRVDCVRPPQHQIEANVGDADVTAVVCGPTRGASIVFYYQFSDPAAMDTVYSRSTNSGPACTSQPRDFRGDGPYSHGGSTGGLTCGKNANGRYLIWTDQHQAIMALAFGGADAPTLLNWWQHDAGPV
jgi:eukaryotic-like serine/threonine-protein kinase